MDMSPWRDVFIPPGVVDPAHVEKFVIRNLGDPEPAPQSRAAVLKRKDKVQRGFQEVGHGHSTGEISEQNM